MRTKILKRVNKYIRIIEDKKNGFLVQRSGKDKVFGPMSDWETINIFSTYQKALKRKHIYIVMVVMRELGYRDEFVRRRTKRKREKGLI